MAESTIWWVLAGGMVALELVSGTFYLLMLSVGMIAAAIAAHVGVTVPLQVTVAAIFGGGSVIALRHYRKSTPTAPAGGNHENLDVGETVQVDVWDAEGTSTVKYRGANWKVSLLEGATPSPGAHRIVEVVGSRLVVKKL
ncbi:MAG: NfeD family protein [Georgfuchsia sp.]